MTRGTPRTIGRLAATTICVVAALACRSHPQPLPTGAALRGVVRTVGTAHDPAVVLAPAGTPSAPAVALADGAQARLLRPLSGVEVELRGTPGAVDGFTVSSFRVVAVGGAPAVDGVLRRGAGGALAVCPAADRCVSLGNPPDALHGMIGARIWIPGPADRGPNQYGVIETPAAPASH